MLRGFGLLAAALVSIIAPTSVAAPTSTLLPAGGTLIWASNREGGRHEIYRLRAGEKQPRRLTSAGGNQPTWSPDGRWIAYLTTNGYPSRLMRSDGSGDRQIHVGYCSFWMHDGSGLVCQSGDQYSLVNPDTGEEKPLFTRSSFPKMANAVFNTGGISADGRWVLAATDLYRPGFAGTNGTFKARWAVVALDRKATDKVYFVGGGCNPTTAPTGTMIYHSCGGSFGECIAAPDIYRFDLTDLPARPSYAAEAAHTNADWGHEYWARISNDGKWLTYAASQGCHDQLTCNYEVFLHQLGTAHTECTRLTVNTANDQHPHLFVDLPAEEPDEGGCRLVRRGVPRWPLAAPLLATLAMLAAMATWRRRR